MRPFLAILASLAITAIATAGPNTWTSGGPPGGHVLCIAIDPVTPSTMYVGLGPNVPAASQFGVFKSVDGGQTWTSASAGLSNGATPPAAPVVRALAIDPSNPTVLYAGVDASPSTTSGVYKSSDAGASWTLVGLSRSSVSSLLITGNGAIVYAGTTQNGIFRSTNGGTAWTPVSGGLPAGTVAGTLPVVETLAVAPGDANTIYAGLGDTRGVYRSTDGGTTWSAFNEGLQNCCPSVRSISASADGTLYATASNASGAGPPVRRRPGENWQALTNPGGTSLSVLAWPVVAGTLLAGRTDGVVRSVDGGATWTITTLSGTAVYALALHPGGMLYAATQGGGVYVSSDAGATWTPLSQGLPRASIKAIVIDPRNSTKVYAATDGGGVYQTADGGATWVPSPLPSASVRALAIAPTDPLTLYAQDWRGHVYRSSDGAVSWSVIREIPISNPLTAAEFASFALAVDPGDAQIVYAFSRSAAGQNRVVRSADRGATWVEGASNLTINVLRVHPQDPNVVFAATTAGVYQSVNTGFSFLPLGLGGTTGSRLRSLEIDPAAPANLYAGSIDNAGLTAYAFASSTGGTSWSTIRTFQSSVGAVVALDPAAPQVIYVASEAGPTLGGGAQIPVLMSPNRGQTWFPFAAGLPSRVVSTALAVGGNGRRLYLGTVAGVFSYEVIDCSHTISPASVVMPTTGGTGSVAITSSDPACAWTASSHSPFIGITGAASGSGSGTLSYAVAANATTLPRSGSMTIAGRTFTVTQGAASGGCDVALSTSAASAPATAMVGVVSVTAASTCSWAVTSSESWLTLNRGAIGIGNGSIEYAVAANPDASPRSAALRVGSQTFTLTQAGASASCTFGLSAIAQSVGGAGASGVITLAASAGTCAWTATSNSSFLSITGARTGTGTAIISYSASANPAASSRVGTLTVAGQTLTITQAPNVATPVNLAVQIAGSTVTLTWSTAGFAPIVAYLVDAGTRPGLRDIGTFRSTTPRFVASNVPAGIYYVRIYSQLLSGSIVGPSEEMVINVGGVALPDAPTQLTASVVGTVVTLTWAAPAGGGAPATYVIEAGSVPGSSNLARFSTGATMTSFATANVPPGTYYVRVRAANAAGIGPPSSDVEVLVR